MISLSQILDSLSVIQLPMRSKFRGITNREIALFKGPKGWGEFSPFLEYEDLEAAMWLKSGVEAATRDDFQVNRDSIKVNGTIPATDSEEEIKALVDLYPGVDVYKVKVGTEIEADKARLKTVKALVPNTRLRIDVNGSWSVDEAERNIKMILDEIGPLEYVEQPVSELDQLRELKKRLKGEVLLVGDEVLRKAENPFNIDLSDAVDILMLKVAPLGGIKRALEIAQRHKLPVVVSSALESGIGITHGLRLSAALPRLDFASGLATGSLMKSDLVQHEIRNGEIKTVRLEPNLDALERYATSKERLEWWRERVKRCWEVAA